MTNRCALDEFEKLAQLRSKQGFTAIQIVIGVPPEVDIFSPEAANTGGLPFNKDFSLNKEYFLEVDKKIEILIKYNLVPCIFGSWGPHIDRLGSQAIQSLWTEIIERYHSYPVIWCVCGEVDLPSSYTFTKKVLKKIFGISYMGNRIAEWSKIGAYIQKTDPAHHPITIHTHSPQRASTLMKDPAWLSIDATQTGHSYANKQKIGDLAQAADEDGRPFINLEPWYEGISNNFYESDQRYAFWTSVLSGAVGHGYGAHGVWNMARDDNFLGHWGNAHWERAMLYQGAQDIAKGATFLTSFPEWWTLEPLCTYPFAAARIKRDMIIGYIENVHKQQVPENSSMLDPRTFEKIANLSALQTNDLVITLKSDTIES